MPERLLLPSPERRANTKTTKGNYPPLVHLFSPHEKRAAGKKITNAPMLLTATVAQGLLSNDGYTSRQISDKFVGNGLDFYAVLLSAYFGLF